MDGNGECNMWWLIELWVKFLAHYRTLLNLSEIIIKPLHIICQLALLLLCKGAPSSFRVYEAHFQNNPGRKVLTL